MAFSTRANSKGRIDRAGQELVTTPIGHHLDETLEVINNWRACHSYPLQVIKMALLGRAKRINNNVLVAQRLKRLPSIITKLQHNPNMKLSQMQDIGGCRAVMPTAADVDKLLAIYEKNRTKNPHDRPIWIAKDDYIVNPKPDGYRGIHLIYKYQSIAEDKTPFNGQRIEVQIRSRLQHAWATAVEIAQTFTGQALKSKIKSANEAWLRFFALMGSAIAIRERRPTVPETPTDSKAIISELKILAEQEKIIVSLAGWGRAIQRMESADPDAHAFLLRLNTAERVLRVTTFRKEELPKAQQQYLFAEKETEQNPAVQVVLVAVDSIDVLRKAYPNYYGDTGEFIAAYEQAVK